MISPLFQRSYALFLTKIMNSLMDFQSGVESGDLAGRPVRPSSPVAQSGRLGGAVRVQGVVAGPVGAGASWRSELKLA